MGEEIHYLVGIIHRIVMLQRVNCAYPPVNFFTKINIRSLGSKFESSDYDQGYAAEKLSGFCHPWKMHGIMNPIYEKENTIQEEMNMKNLTKEEAIERVRYELKSYIVAAGYTQKEAVEACADEFENWKPSDSNFSNKLDKGTFRYLDARQLAEVLGYEIIWRRRRDD